MTLQESSRRGLDPTFYHCHFNNRFGSASERRGNDAGTVSPLTLESAGQYLYGLKDFSVIRRWDKTSGLFSDIAGFTLGFADGTGPSALFNQIGGIATGGQACGWPTPTTTGSGRLWTRRRVERRSYPRACDSLSGGNSEMGLGCPGPQRCQPASRAAPPGSEVLDIVEYSLERRSARGYQSV